MDGFIVLLNIFFLGEKDERVPPKFTPLVTNITFIIC